MHEVIERIFLAKNVTQKKERTLIFIDEIQHSPEAMALLRYFYDDAPQYFIIAAGSLLEVMMQDRNISFPVGRVEYRFMYPLSFEEFLIASGHTQALEYYRKIPSPPLAHDTLLKLFHQFSMVGGMPEIIQSYTKNHEVQNLKPIYQSLLTSYEDDIGKYARTPVAREHMRFALESAPYEAGKRIKFHGFGNSNYRSQEMGEALRILERAMLVYLMYPTTVLKNPPIEDRRKSPKLYFLDTGLLNYVVGLHEQFFRYQDLHSFYQGIIAEHMVIQEFIGRDTISSIKPKFWVREQKQANAELDAVIPYGELLIPVEVKSGKSGTLRSLHEFIDRCDHCYGVRLYAGLLTVDKTQTASGKPFFLLNLPYCFAGKIDQYIPWFVEGNHDRGTKAF